MHQPKDADWLNGYKNKTLLYAAYRRPTSDLETHTTESKRMEKDTPCESKLKETWSDAPYLRQNKL